MNQNCPHEGADHRCLGKLGCAVQAALSVKEGGPRYWMHDGARAKFVLAYPPYLAGALKWKSRWLQLRLGVRYDQFWKGYICPCISLKRVWIFFPF